MHDYANKILNLTPWSLNKICNVWHIQNVVNTLSYSPTFVFSWKLRVLPSLYLSLSFLSFSLMARYFPFQMEKSFCSSGLQPYSKIVFHLVLLFYQLLFTTTLITERIHHTAMLLIYLLSGQYIVEWNYFQVRLHLVYVVMLIIL